MQTFLPFPDFVKSAQCLDWRRLGKQRVEAFQLLVAIGDAWAIIERSKRGITSPGRAGWRNHPAAKMWRGHNDALGIYMNCIIREWVRRGYKNTMSFYPETICGLPPWFGNEPFHASHRSNLLRKDTKYYSQFGWTESSDLPYIWPPGN